MIPGAAASTRPAQIHEEKSRSLRADELERLASQHLDRRGWLRRPDRLPGLDLELLCWLAFAHSRDDERQLTARDDDKGA
jgi:hypothetical protein